MKSITFIRAIALFFFFNISISFAQPGVDAKVENLLSRMSLEEKVGQMTQLTIDKIIDQKNEPVIDKIKINEILVKHHIGSILNVATHAYTIEEWHTLIKGIQDVATKETRLKIPVIYGIDAIHGATYTLGSTLFPQNIAIAASRNPELAFKCAEVTAKEARASGIRWNFAPVLDLGRQPLWPRFGETYGEDVYLDGIMGQNSIKGMQGSSVSNINNVAACMKHFIGYSLPNSGKDRTPSYIPEIMLREYFLPPFKKAVDAGVQTVMINSAEVNGSPVHASKYLLTDILRNELGFKGVVVSDWEDIIRLHTRHKIAATPKEAVKLAVNAGIDMSMTPYDLNFYTLLIELVKEGEVPEAKINEAVRRILKLKYDLGLFDDPYPEAEALKNFGLPEYKKLALEGAREAITLAKNENNVLPLIKGKNILVTGPGANSVTCLNGCWSYTWQGTRTEYYPKDAATILSAIKSKSGDANVTYIEGTGFEKDINTSKVANAAKNADYIIVCLGEEAYAETPGDIDELDLPIVQQNLATILYTTGKPVILVFTEGRPRIFRNIEAEAKGVVLAYWPGSQGGNAIADILFGDYNPCGKLPFSYPRFAADIKFYDHKFTETLKEYWPWRVDSLGYNPQYPFGHGLSYTTFEYSNLRLNSNTLTSTGTLKVFVDVKNSGQKAGKIAVELYTHDLFASITPSQRRLRKFNKIYLEPDKQQTVEFEINKDDLAFVDKDLKTITEPGEFEVIIGNLTAKFNYK
jgi:beta-glucosidase